jgi:hypothetical protein
MVIPSCPVGVDYVQRPLNGSAKLCGALFSSAPGSHANSLTSYLASFQGSRVVLKFTWNVRPVPAPP